jgi:excisionase family DNA binding protein
MATPEPIAPRAQSVIPPIFCTVKEAAYYLKRSPASIYMMLKNGELKAKQDGKLCRIFYSSVVARAESLPDRLPGKQAPGLAGNEGKCWETRHRKKQQPKRQRRRGA